VAVRSASTSGRRASAENGRLVRQCADAFDLRAAARPARRGGTGAVEALLSFLRESRQLSNRAVRELRLKYRYPTPDALLRRSGGTAGQMKGFDLTASQQV
jgi:hypothetical protein